MAKKRESYDVFAVPRNFGEDGMSFNGLSRRNLVEGIILALASGYPIVTVLSVSTSLKVILLCFISLPLFFVGLVGFGGESLSQFICTVIKWLFTRRRLRYYIDIGEPEPPKLKGLVRIKAMFRKKDKDDIRYKRVRKEKRKSGGLFDKLFSAKKRPGAEDGQSQAAKKNRTIKDMAQEFYPIGDIRHGMVITKDKRYIKVVEIQPINFLLRSADEQRDIIMSFAELLRIAPVKIQMKSNANRADISKFLETTITEMKQETDPSCQELDKDYIEHIQSIATNNAISRRFFVIFEYENTLISYTPSEMEIKFHLESAVKNFRSYLSRCGNSTVEFTKESEENEFLLGILFTLTDHYNTGNMSLQNKIDRAFKWRLMGDNLDEMCTADYACPDDLDFTHAKYAVIDGVYHAYLYIPGAGYKTLVGAAWLSPLINAGEAIDVDLFLQKMPSDTMQVQVSRNLRLNKAKISEVSSTSADYNKMGDIMESGYYLQRGLNDGQEFFYMTVLVTVKAYSKKDLENRVNEVVKMMVAKQIQLKYCAYRQEQAFLSTLPLAKLHPNLYKLGKRNILTNTAASTYMFTSFEICDDDGIFLGTNEHNNSLVILDMFNNKKYKSANAMIAGTTGAGKTFTLQTIATRLRRKHVQTFILAPLKGHEFARCCKAIGGAFIKLSPGSPHCINVMEIRPVDNSVYEILDEFEEVPSYLSEKIDSLLGFFTILMPEMSNVEEQLLDEALINTYAKVGITHDNDSLWDPDNPDKYKEMPILGDLYEELRRNPKAERLAIILNRFVGGSAKSFNQRTNITLDNKYIVIDISNLKNKLLSAGLYIAFDYIWSKCKENRLDQKAIIIDEIWRLVGASSSPVAAETTSEIWKIARAYNTSAIGALQNLSECFDLDGGKWGKSLIALSPFKIIMNLEPKEADTVGEMLQMTATEIHKVKNFERGHGILSARGNNVAIHIQASTREADLITSDPEELRRIMAAKKKDSGPAPGGVPQGV